MQIPFWMLFRHEDIPFHLRRTEFNALKLTDQNFLNQLAVWMNVKINEAGLIAVSCPGNFGILQEAMMLLLNRPEFSEKANDFIIGHEVAHLAHELERENAFFIQKINKITFLVTLGIISILFVTCLTAVLVPLCGVGVAVTAGVSSLVISSGSFIWLSAQYLPLPSVPSPLEEEKNADLDSVEALQSAAGGIYYFEVSQCHNQLVRSSRLSLSTAYDTEGNNLLDGTHPLLSERIAYLNAWQSQLVQPLESRVVHLNLLQSQHLQRA